MMQDLVVHLVYIAFAIGMLLTFGTILTWVERKQAAVMSDRIGANRAYIRLPYTQIKLVWIGLFHGIADGLKMMLKEDFKPATYDAFAYAIAPWIVPETWPPNAEVQALTMRYIAQHGEKGFQAAISSGSGSRFPGGRHFTTLAM